MTTSQVNPATPAGIGIEDTVRFARPGYERPWLLVPLRWVRLGLSRAMNRVCAAARAAVRSIRALLSRALRSLSDAVGKPVQLIKAVLRMIAKDRGFGFWWLAATAAVAVSIGILLGLVLSPVIGIIAALIVGIWMLVRRASQRGTAVPA